MHLLSFLCYLPHSVLIKGPVLQGQEEIRAQHHDVEVDDDLERVDVVNLLSQEMAGVPF